MSNPVAVSFGLAIEAAKAAYARKQWEAGNRSVKLAEAVIGQVSQPSKMPCYGYSTPAESCHSGSAMGKLAGAICASCYAQKGAYIWDSARIALGRRERLVRKALDDRAFRKTYVEAFTWLLNYRQQGGTERGQWFRWHDSGDVWSCAHLLLIAEICQKTPDVQHWIPTREYRYVREFLGKHGAFPRNLQVKLSSHWFDKGVPESVRNTPGVSTTTAHTSHDALEALKAQGYSECQAYTTNGECGDCRECWFENDKTYPAH